MGLVAEAQRRRVFRVAAGYLVFGWLLIQVAATVLPQFDLPGWAPRLVTLLVALGFPIALVVAWMFDLTSDGIRMDASSTGSKRLLVFASVLIALSVGWYLHDRPMGIAPTAVPAAAEASIAVLPFLDMSQAHDQGYFSDGLSEELLNLLAQVPQLRVISRTSSFSFKNKDVDVATIAKSLNVANVLEGSVRKSGNTLRITAQLIRASDSSHLWSQTYDRQLTDVFRVQDDIAAAVVAALKVKLLPTQVAVHSRTANPEAHDQYLIGKQLAIRSTPDDWRRAVAALARAIVLDPTYGAAYAELSGALGSLGDAYGNKTLMAQSLRMAEIAIGFSPTLANAYLQHGYAVMSIRNDWTNAKADFDKALLLTPGDSQVQLGQGRMMIAFGRLPQAIAFAKKGAALDPLDPYAWADLGRYLNADHQLEAARSALNKALEIAPDSSYMRFHVGENALLDGRPKDALAIFQRTGGGYQFAGIAMAEHSLGDEDASRRALQQQIANYAQGSAYQAAEAFAWRGENDKAFVWLDRAIAQHDGGLTFIKCDPLLASLYTDPRYPLLLGKLGLPSSGG